MRRFALPGAIVLAFILAFGVYRWVKSNNYSEQDVVEFLASCQKSAEEKLAADPAQSGRDVPARARAYCDCASGKILSGLPYKDFKAIANGTPEPEVVKRVMDIVRDCSEQTLLK